MTVDASDVRWLAERDRANRRLIGLTLASVTLDIALTVVLVFFGIALHHEAASNANLCRSGNVSRVQQVQLWDYILKLSPPPKDAAGQARVADFRHHLDAIFAPRNCANIDPQKP